MMMTKRMTSHLNGYSYNGRKEKDGAKKESETKDRSLPFVIVRVIKETNAVYCDAKD